MPCGRLSLLLVCFWAHVKIVVLYCIVRSKVMVPIGSPLVVFCLTSILSNLVFLTIFEIFDAEFLWPRSRTVQGHPRSKSWCQSIVHRWFPIRLLLTPSSYLSPFLNIWRLISITLITRTVQGHPRSKIPVPIGSPLVVFIWRPLCPTLYLSRHSSYLMCTFCDLHLERFKVIQGQSHGANR